MLGCEARKANKHPKKENSFKQQTNLQKGSGQSEVAVPNLSEKQEPRERFLVLLSFRSCVDNSRCNCARDLWSKRLIGGNLNLRHASMPLER